VYVGSLVLAGCAFLCWLQASYWTDSISIFRHTLQACGSSTIIHGNLGMLLSRSQNPGTVQEGIKQMEKAVALDPANTQVHFRLAEVFSDLGQPVLAVPHWREAARLTAKPLSYYNLGV